MTRVICAQQITDPNAISPDTLFIVEIGVNTPPKIVFEKGLTSNSPITMTPTVKYYKITAHGDPGASKEPAPAQAAAQVSAAESKEAQVSAAATESKAQSVSAQAAAATESKEAAAQAAAAQAAAAAAESKVQAPEPTDKVCGLSNPSSMCYLNSAIQLLLDIPEIPEYFFNKKTDEPIKYAISPQCKNPPDAIQVTEYNKNIKLLQHIFNTIKTDSAKTPKTATDIIKIKTPVTASKGEPVEPTADNTAYYELAKSHADAFLNDQAQLKQDVLDNITAYPGVTPANVDKFIEDEIASLEKKYSQADPHEFLLTLFFPNFECVDDPKNFTKNIGVTESSEIVCENNTKYDTASVYSPIIELHADTTNKTISDLLKKHKEIEQIVGKSAQCKTDTDPNENQKTKQIKHTLQPKDTKYIILYLNRNMYDNSTRQQVRNTTEINITNEITIDKVQFRRKGCIFHTGNATGGHYVYGSYDKDGNPNHVRDDARIIQASAGIAPKVFDQEGYLSTLCLYERIETQTLTQPTIGGSIQTKKRKHKNKKRKTQHKKRN